MKILLTGEPGIGKTTLIKKLLQKLGKKARGFWTEEIRDKNTKKRIGFKVINTEGQETVFASKYFTSKHLVGSYGVNVSRLRLFEKPLIGTSPQPLRGLTFSSPCPTPLPQALASEGKGPSIEPFQEQGRGGLPSELAKHFERLF